jgi:uncharacterized membrane protein YuzA (DUF378 family)
MFCPTCGKGEQESDTYCRNCGEFLTDVSSRPSLLARLLGIYNPEKQLNITLIIDLVTAIVSGTLLFFIKGYFDAVEDRTGVSPSPLVYVLYAFLGLVAVWQLFSFVIGTTYKRKLRASRRGGLEAKSERQSLGPRNFRDPVSVSEEVTRNLEKLPRGK